MTPIPSPGVLHGKDNVLLNRFESLDVESERDEGSDMEDMPEYLLRIYDIDQDEVTPDDGYNDDLMENDGTYDTNHVWTYEDLTEELPEPTNLYNGHGPCLRRALTCVAN